MKTKHYSNGVVAKRVVVKGNRMVMLEETEFDRLLRKADEFEPLLPAPLPNGNYPAGEYLRVSLAIKIIRHRRRLGLTQVELARRSGIRAESLNRIEQGQPWVVFVTGFVDAVSHRRGHQHRQEEDEGDDGQCRAGRKSESWERVIHSPLQNLPCRPPLPGGKQVFQTSAHFDRRRRSPADFGQRGPGFREALAIRRANS